MNYMHSEQAKALVNDVNISESQKRRAIRTLKHFDAMDLAQMLGLKKSPPPPKRRENR